MAIVETIEAPTGARRRAGKGSASTSARATCEFLAYYAKRSKKILAERSRRMHLLSPMKKQRMFQRVVRLLWGTRLWRLLS